MIYRRFGRTNLQMPVFSCGGMRYQYKWQDVPMGEVPEEHQRNLENTIRRAVELGINHIETARGYGSSERQLGQILPTFRREDLIVQTKVGCNEDGDQFLKDFEDSLARLRLNHVDLLAIHGINNHELLEQSTRPGGCLAACRKIQKRGLARHIGFSTHGPTDVIVDAVKTGEFDYVNLHWFYLFQKNWPAIEEATKRDMGVFIISPSDKGGMLYDPPARLTELCRPLHPLVFNDLFCLSHPQVHTLSIGAARPTDFDLHMETLPLMERAGELLPPIIQRLQETMRSSVAADLLDPFSMGLPEWDRTPGQVNLPVILWLLNLANAYDMVKYGQMRYNLLGSGGHWFPGQNAEKMDDQAITEALGGTAFAKKVPALAREAHEKLAKDPVKRLSQS